MSKTTWEKIMEGISEDEGITEVYLALLSVRIETLMKRRGLTQKELAEGLGMKQSQISAILNCDQRNMTLKTIARFEAYFGEEIIRVPGKQYTGKERSLRVVQRQPERKSPRRSSNALASETTAMVREERPGEERVDDTRPEDVRVSEERPVVYTAGGEKKQQDFLLTGIETLRFSLTTNPGWNGDTVEGTFYFWLSAEVFDVGFGVRITIEFFFNTDEETFALSPYKLETTLRCTYFTGGRFGKNIPSWQIRAIAADALAASRGVLYAQVQATGNKPVIMPPVKEEEIEVE